LTELRTLLALLAHAEPARRQYLLGRLSGSDTRAFDEDWDWQAHGGQREPPGDWRIWLMLAGRGFGKTKAGAQWVLARAREAPGARIALIGSSISDAGKVMIEGESGLIASARTGERLDWRVSAGELRFPSGAVAHLYSGANPAKLRGPQHHFAWADEIGKWRKASESWDNLELGMRLGERPRIVVTTTPGQRDLVTRIRSLDAVATSGGRTIENPHLPPAFVAAMESAYGGSRLGRQELDGIMLGEAEGALWTRDMIEQARVAPLATTSELLKRVVIGVDPPASAHGDACGIVACGRMADGRAAVLADCTVAGKRPEGWARAVVATAEWWGADRVVAEANNGGDMIENVLRSVRSGLPVKLVRASRGKAARAEPIAAAFEAGQCKLAGLFPELEEELTSFTAEGYVGSGSPDRADAMVWALTELVLRGSSEPRVRML
jgi:phage terminase large subunit-like protein